MIKYIFILCLGMACSFSTRKKIYRSPVMSRPRPIEAKPLGLDYLSDPMARVEVMYPKVKDFAKPYYGFKMVGEQFFKHPGHDDETTDGEELPYTLIQDFGPYELREYPAAKFACVKSEVDTAEDPLAGLDNVNPFILMSSKRWRKTPSSIMFMELFKYISGVNKEGHEVEMTRPVSTRHSIQKKQFGGDVEIQEMCFYIPAHHQANPPEPTDSSPVYIHERPRMRVYALRFGGFALTSDKWSQQRDLLDNLLLGKPHHDTEYYSNGFDAPMTLFNRRNEIWIQALEPGPPVVAAVQAEVEEEEDEPVAEPDHVLPAEEKKE